MADDKFTEQLRTLGTDARRNAYLECAIECLQRAEIEINAGHPFASTVCRQLGEAFQAKAALPVDFTGLDAALAKAGEPL